MKRISLKKTSIVLASLSLLLPLALPANASTSVEHYHARINKVAHRSTGNAVAKHRLNTKRHRHHYYKFAYDKKQYRLAMARMRQDKHMYLHTADMLTKKRPRWTNRKLYRHGIFDAYGRFFNKKLALNKSYRAGYIMGVRDMSGYMMTKKDASGYYCSSAKYGVGMMSYTEHFKVLAHENLLY